MKSSVHITISKVTEDVEEFTPPEHAIKFESHRGEKTVESLPVGDTLSIYLPYQAGTGFIWSEQSDANQIGGLTFVDSKPVKRQHPHPHGAEEFMVFHYKAEKASSTPSTITLEYGWPWEPDVMKS